MKPPVGRRIAGHGAAVGGHLRYVAIQAGRGPCRLATIPLVCLVQAFGQKLEHRIAIPPIVFAEPKLD